MPHEAVLKALDMSRDIIAQRFLRCSGSTALLLTSFIMFDTASIVDIPLRKPYCWSLSLLFVSRWVSSIALIILSKNFLTVSRRHIGLYEDGWFSGLSPYLSNTRLARFHLSGNTPSFRHVLNRPSITSGLPKATALTMGPELRPSPVLFPTVFLRRRSLVFPLLFPGTHRWSRILPNYLWVGGKQCFHNLLQPPWY